jgi:hypothetical protein
MPNLFALVSVQGDLILSCSPACTILRMRTAHTAHAMAHTAQRACSHWQYRVAAQLVICLGMLPYTTHCEPLAAPLLCCRSLAKVL